MKLSIILESIASCVSIEPCEIKLRNGYFTIKREGFEVEVNSECIAIRQNTENPKLGFGAEQMSELHSLWRLIKWNEVNQITSGLVDLLPPHYRVNTFILDKINMYKKLLLQTGLNEFKQFKSFFETEYRY